MLDVKNYKLNAQLVPNAIGDKAYLQTPCVSPWRTIMMSDDAEILLVLNDFEPK
jgi:hypothetical protein